MADTENRILSRFDRYLSVGSNIAVLFGILFLGYELRLNNQLLQLEARSAASQNMQGVVTAYTDNASLFEIREKYNNGEQLTNLESAKLFQFFFLTFSGWQDGYYYYASGLLGETRDMQIKSFLRNLEEPVFSDHWKLIKEELTVEFVQYLEKAMITE